jgi:hypothetical protein
MATVVSNVRDSRGLPMTKGEVILELVKATFQSGYRYPDRAIETYDTLVKDKILEEKEVDSI